MKLTIQYYDKDPKAAKASVAKVLKDLKADDLKPDLQQVEVKDNAAAKAIMKDLSPIPNIQIG